MVVCYLVCWLPYGVVAIMATFGSEEPLSPEASIMPSLLAKSSTVVNPFIYIFMNKQVGLSATSLIFKDYFGSNSTGFAFCSNTNYLKVISLTLKC